MSITSGGMFFEKMFILDVTLGESLNIALAPAAISLLESLPESKFFLLFSFLCSLPRGIFVRIFQNHDNCFFFGTYIFIVLLKSHDGIFFCKSSHDGMDITKNTS